MIEVHSSGSGDMDKALKQMGEMNALAILHEYGHRGVDALSNATPKDSGRASSSWFYIIETSKSGYALTWCNSDIEGGALVVLLIQYGHGTGTGGYVEGIDYINPVIEPMFQDIADDIWKEVRNA